MSTPKFVFEKRYEMELGLGDGDPPDRAVRTDVVVRAAEPWSPRPLTRTREGAEVKPEIEFRCVEEVPWTQCEGSRRPLGEGAGEGRGSRRRDQDPPVRAGDRLVRQWRPGPRFLGGAVHPRVASSGTSRSERPSCRMQSCRPPGMEHGPWISETGCEIFEVRYQSATGSDGPERGAGAMTPEGTDGPVEAFLEMYGRQDEELLDADQLSAPGVFEGERSSSRSPTATIRRIAIGRSRSGPRSARSSSWICRRTSSTRATQCVSRRRTGRSPCEDPDRGLPCGRRAGSLHRASHRRGLRGQASTSTGIRSPRSH